MEYRILGGLEVQDGTRAVPVRGPRRRALLVHLLVNANEVVPVERLLEDLWGGEQPASGLSALRVRVSQLRKAIEEEDGDAVILTRPPGYVLHVAPDQLDALRFERLLARGRKALTAGKAELAAATLRDALALWRGPALADVAYEPWAQAEIARLEELRKAALEERIDADLALGRHAELVGELEALVTAEPLRERLRGQLMLALYRSGRQADALAAYRAAREALVGELGLEPGPALQELEGAILRQDPGLAAPERAVEEAVETAPPPLAPVGAERKVVTMLVADLAGSAALAQEQDPERAGALLERLVGAIGDEVEAAGGRVESVTGVAVTAVFGAPVAQEDHVERALQAALSLPARLSERFGGGVTLRVGVDTGEVVVDRPGGGSSTLTGGAVVTAARLARAAGPGTTLAGERTAAAARGLFEFGLSLAEGAQGGGRLACRQLVRALALVRTEGGGGLRAGFVGRESELELLRSAYRRVRADARPRLVTLLGDAGVGKSRLVRELWDELAVEEPEPLRRTGRCLPYGRGTTYRPFADVLREQLGLVETEAPETVRRRLGDREVLALTLGVAAAPDLHPLTAREQLHEAWVELLTDLAAERPVVVAVEDLHWAQEPLLDLLERVLDDVDGPLLLVGTARPELLETRPSWGRRREAATVWLEPLSGAESVELLTGLGAGDLPGELRGPLLERAEGNPFFLEELLAGVHDRSLPAGSSVPDSVQAVLAARIDLLPPLEKAALQAAAVMGRVFWRGAVCDLLDGEEPDFAVLEARDFIRRRSGPSLAGEREYAFKHALTREVAYASLPRARRALLHARFAAWVERVAGPRDEHAPYLAHHYYEAVRPEDADLAWAGWPEELARLRAEAVAWLRRAGDLAAARYELDEAIALYERALELEEDEAVRVQLWRVLGLTNALKYDAEAFWQAMHNAIAGTEDRALLAELYAELSFETGIRAGMWRQRPSAELVDGLIERALELAEPGSRAEAMALLALCHWNPEGAGNAAARASRTAERLGDAELRSYAWDARGVTDFVAGEYDLGRAWEERRFELLEEISDPEHAADIHYAPITGCVLLGYFGEARRLALRHDEISRVLTPHHRMHGIAVLLELEELLGTWQNATALQGEAEARVAANAATPCVRNARALLVCAVASHLHGDEDRARRLEERAEDMRLEGFGHVLDTPRMRLALVRGDLGAAERLLAEPMPVRGWHRGWLLISTHATHLDALAALGNRDGVEAWPRVRPNTYVEPFHLRALGVVREDETLLTQALVRFEGMGLHWHAAQTAVLLGDS
ncbi:MAG TPA: BTAD domain-containing putative transcriptional regulator [Gaiellaceae bacterium]|nr:BTAD domain-containing putative transcriptional regulator [Gaiellaceae bacterium]